MEKTKRNQKNILGFTQPFWVRPLLRRAGFTLGEMITTVAIIGTIAAIAVPNYIRIKMNANEEMVRQQMRIVAEKMTEIVGKKGQYPNPSSWPENLNPGDLDEVSLMGNLSAIDDMCYTNTDYTTNELFTTYRFCAQPKTDSCGRWAGTKRFCVHSSVAMSTLFAPGVVGEVSKSDATDRPMILDTTSIGDYSDFSTYILNNPDLTTDDKAEMFTNMVERFAYYLDFRATSHRECLVDDACSGVGRTNNPTYYQKFDAMLAQMKDLSFSTYLIFDPDNRPLYNTIFHAAEISLAEKGIQIIQTERKVEDYQTSMDVGDGYNPGMAFEVSPNPVIYEVAFQLQNHVETWDEFLALSEEIGPSF